MGYPALPQLIHRGILFIFNARSLHMKDNLIFRGLKKRYLRIFKGYKKYGVQKSREKI